MKSLLLDFQHCDRESYHDDSVMRIYQLRIFCWGWVWSTIIKPATKLPPQVHCEAHEIAFRANHPELFIPTPPLPRRRVKTKAKEQADVSKAN